MSPLGISQHAGFSARAKYCGKVFGKGGLLPLILGPAQSPFRSAAHLPPNRAAEKPTHLLDDWYRLCSFSQPADAACQRTRASLW